VGHDINNPLAYISTNLVVLRELCKTMRDELEQAGIPCRSLGVDLQEIEEIMADCEDGVQRIAGIVDDLGRVFRGRESGSCAVRVVVDAAARMASNEIRHRAIFSAEISGEPLVCISESKLIQILLNILVNAAHAITPGSIDRNRITLQSWEEGEWVVLRISDTGSGMTEEVKARLFEPLFTTKPEGIGTGLGMSIVDRILKESGGRISLTSAPGQGTTFTIHLPNAEAILEEDDLETDSLHGAARVLIIDDEVRVTRALRRLMRQLCAVTEAHGAEDALRLIRGGARFDVILCDLMMPETSGEELLQLLQAEAPEQAERLVFMTGGAFTEQARDFIDETPRPVLKKPLTPRQIRDVIAGRHAQLGAERY
jgi:CheY-like chemotaxis protein